MNEINKNDLCPCSSGKKYKKCCINKKPRSQAILFELGIVSDIYNIHLQTDSNSNITFFCGDKEITPVNAFHQSFYKGENGKEKILNQIQLERPNSKADLNSELVNFDFIFAVDTNTKPINGEKLSVCSVIYCEKKTIEKNSADFLIGLCGSICIKGIPDKYEEKFGIKLLIDRLVNHPNYNNTHRIGIITDHDRKNLIKYNDREMPIYENWYLPDNFKLIYASADKSKKNDSLPNHLISDCDKEANEVFEEVKKNIMPVKEFKDIKFSAEILSQPNCELN